MANLNLKFLRGLQVALPTTGTDGYFYLATDTHRLYTSIDGKVVPVNEGVTTVANLDALTSVAGAQAGDFFYCTEENILAVYNGQNFVQINPDTGMTSVEVVGEGNAITDASYDSATRKLTLTKGETFATQSELSNLNQYIGTIPETSEAQSVVDYVNEKTAGIATDAALESLTNRVTQAEKDIDANADAIAAIKDGTTYNSFGDVENRLGELDQIVSGLETDKVDKVEGKSLVDDSEITKLAGVSEGANKVEKSDTNGNIKIDGVETVVYTHPTNHAISDITGLQDALDGKQAAGDYSVVGHKHVKADITDFTHTHIASEITDLDAAIKAYDYATKTELGTAVQGAKDYAKDLVEAIPAQTDYTVTITENTDDTTVAKTYVFSQCGAEIGSIKLAKELVVTSGAVKEVTEADAPYAGAKVGDKYIELVIANQDTPIYVPAKDLVDIYTAKGGAAEVQVAISNTNEISATLVNGGVTEDKLADGVKTKLNKTWEEVGVAKGLVDALADGQVKTNKEAIEAINNTNTGILKQAKDYADGLASNYAAADHDHVAADITDFAAEVAKVKVDEAVKATQDGNSRVIADTYAEKATTLEGYGITDAYTKEETADLDATVLAEAQQYADQAEADAVSAASTDAQAKVDALANGQVATNAADIAALQESATWGTF